MIRLPDAVHNPVSLFGVAIASVMATVFIALSALELLGLLTNPYIGLLVFITIPAIFVVGLLLIPFGMWWSARRRRLGRGRPEWPVIDLAVPRQRAVLLGVLVLSLVNALIVSLAAYGTVHYMESAEFCGQVCHTTMEPQAVAHKAWPHARVACTQCHVGPGAGAFVESKMAGTRQLFKIMTDRVPTPVPTPGGLIQKTSEACGQCHWPDKGQVERLQVVREYGNDEASTETVTRLQVHVGGGSARLGAGAGSHWHSSVGTEIDYIATDAARETIPYVRLKDAEGRVHEYVVDGVAAAQVDGGMRRRMDCIDCHSRPAHTFDTTAERAIDVAIARGRIPRALPFARRETLAAVKAAYPSRAEGLAAIERRLRSFYASLTPAADGAAVARAVTAAQDVWSGNVFPAMKVTWGTYVNQLGHIDTPGCFRCHDDNHKTADGRVIRQDCDLCHTLPGE
jgi:hypothetical protein